MDLFRADSILFFSLQVKLFLTQILVFICEWFIFFVGNLRFLPVIFVTIVDTQFRLHYLTLKDDNMTTLSTPNIMIALSTN